MPFRLRFGVRASDSGVIAKTQRSYFSHVAGAMNFRGVFLLPKPRFSSERSSLGTWWVNPD